MVDGLKAIGALGMKVKEEYGGLGLSQVYYNRAIGLAASWHSSIALLLSAHQSIGVAEPLRLFGSEEQKRKWLPLVAKDHISAFLLTEPEVGSDPARMGAVATPVYDDIVATPVEGGYSLSGRKLWATNGTIADITVVMAKVPESEGHRGGISAFVMPYDSEGVTVEHRNAFMGLRGIENSVTLLDNVFVPEENRIAREGDGLKIALSTLNTGRLGVMASAVGAAKWSTKIAREWAAERAQWGRSIGKHDAVAQMVAFIAGSAFGLEAMLDVVGRLADNKANDVRTEAAMCKVYGAELAWRVIDTLVQLRGGRGYETAASLKARGEKPVPVEQMMRDFRVNRIFEGSSEIMHLMIAREGVESLLKEASDAPQAGRRRQDDGGGCAQRRGVYCRGCRAGGRRGPEPALLRRVRPARQLPALRRALLAQAGTLDPRGRGPLGGKAPAKAVVPWPHRRHRHGAVRDRRNRLLRRHDRERASRAQDRGNRARRAVLRAGQAPRRDALQRAVGQSTTTPITPPPSRCWPVATRGWRTGSPTRRATGR